MAYFREVDECDALVAAIFKDHIPDDVRHNPDVGQYLNDLCSYGIDRLGREPELLAEERTQIQQQTEDLAFNNYKTFIQTAECSKEIFSNFQVVEQHMSSLVDTLPVFVQKCNDFMKKAQEINASRKMNSVTLQRHTQLLEILEIPQLMDTCVRNGYYDEALELAIYVKRMERKHSSIPLIVSIVNEVKSSLQLMLIQLLQQLRANVQLPTCLRVVGYLRRLDVFTEAELRMKFLQARNTWFEGVIASIPNNDAYQHISKVIEVSRVHLFDIVTQYRAIFSDDDPLPAYRRSADDSANETGMFHSWIMHKVTQFLRLLEVDLTIGVGARLDSLLAQCMYFGLSFSRIGADFRGLLVPLFEAAVLGTYQRALHDASAKFDEAMQSFTLLGQTTSSISQKPAEQVSSGLYPPMSMLDYPPLAAFCNSLLTAMNDLRLCAPLSLAADVARLTNECLLRVATAIADYHRAEVSSFSDREQQHFVHLCTVFGHQFVPFVGRCVHSIYPPTQLATAVGLSSADISRKDVLGGVRADVVLAPLNAFVSPIAELSSLDSDGGSQPSAAADSARPTSAAALHDATAHDEPHTAPASAADHSEDLLPSALEHQQPAAFMLEPELSDSLHADIDSDVGGLTASQLLENVASLPADRSAMPTELSNTSVDLQTNVADNVTELAQHVAESSRMGNNDDDEL